MFDALAGVSDNHSTYSLECKQFSLCILVLKSVESYNSRIVMSSNAFGHIWHMLLAEHFQLDPTLFEQASFPPFPHRLESSGPNGA